MRPWRRSTATCRVRSQRGQLDEAGRKAILERIHFAPTFDKLGDCDLVVEAASENEEVKRKIFTRSAPS